MTKVLTTPCTKDSVIMSPLATWPISWASTARASRSSKRLNKPLLTATSALLRFQPVAKALAASEGKMPTSGIPMPASSASDLTVSSSHCSSPLRGVSISWVPVPRLAMNLDSSNEIREPLIPNNPQNTSRLPKLRSTPLLARIPSRPSRLKMTLTSTKTARLVARNNRILIFCAPKKTPIAHSSMGSSSLFSRLPPLSGLGTGC